MKSSDLTIFFVLLVDSEEFLEVVMRQGFLLSLFVAIGCGEDLDNDGVNALPEGDDCNDDDPLISPYASEICDEKDNDCDNLIDEGVTQTFYLDSDGDGYGVESLTIEGCDVPPGYAALMGDCDDFDASVSPGTTEVCDYVDNNCDAKIDEGVEVIFYYDGDGDGVGNSDLAIAACQDQPPTDPTAEGVYVLVGGDCDDDDAQVSPYAIEICDGIDNDCLGNADGDDDQAIDAATWYYDGDSDGHGEESGKNKVKACHQPESYVDNAEDCDDTEATINPAAAEVCDEIDNDCDGEVDGDLVLDGQLWYGDADQDGFGGTDFIFFGCENAKPEHYVAGDVGVLESMDCNDLDDAINPDADEICDEIDNDCDGFIDDADSNITHVDAAGATVLWYIDADGDGFGSDTFTLEQCDQPDGYVASDDMSMDCDDLEFEVNPGQAEVCNDWVDNDCWDGQDCELVGQISVTDDFTETAYEMYSVNGSEGVETFDELGDELGSSMAIGDFNGDDFDDLVIGAIGVDNENRDAGAAYVFFGPLSSYELDAQTNADVVFYGDADADHVGYAVAAIDLDGDGYDDLAITSSGEDVISSGEENGTGIENVGQVYLLYGSSDLGAFNSGVIDEVTEGSFIGSNESESFGCSLTNAGDLNGDAREDLVVGGCADNASGDVYLIYGSSTRTTQTVTPENQIFSLTDGFAKWTGEMTNSFTGRTSGSLGDINGDGLDDFGIGASGYDATVNTVSYTDAGAAYVIVGDGSKHNGAASVDFADAYFRGQNSFDEVGSAVSGVGDVDGDGYNDMVIGAKGYDSDRGAVYLIAGSGSLSDQMVQRTRLVGESNFDAFGTGAGNVGDINDDGYSDVVIGAPEAEGVPGTIVGATYLFYGTIESGEVDAGDCDVKFTGSPSGSSAFGSVLTSQGDLNGDGELDLAIGAPLDDINGATSSTNSGGVYLFTGGGI